MANVITRTPVMTFICFCSIRISTQTYHVVENQPITGSIFRWTDEGRARTGMFHIVADERKMLERAKKKREGEPQPTRIFFARSDIFSSTPTISEPGTMLACFLLSSLPHVTRAFRTRCSLLVARTLLYRLLTSTQQ